LFRAEDRGPDAMCRSVYKVTSNLAREENGNGGTKIRKFIHMSGSTGGVGTACWGILNYNAGALLVE